LQTASQKAKARARQRTKFAGPANDNVVQLVAPLELTAGDVIHEDNEEAPFAPPPADDIFGLGEIDEDEETIFVSAGAPEEEDEDEAPFDPPELEAEPTFSVPQHVEPKPEAPKLEQPKPISPPPQRDRPLPAIKIHMGWDRSEAETLMRELAADKRLVRAEISISRGGLDGALAGEEIDLFVLDSNLEGAAMLAALDRLRAKAPSACIVMLGAVNDIALLRDLAARGVSDYIVPPASADQIARSLCALFADVTPAQVIAIVGARGGIGASTLARNLAWSIAERQHRKTTLVDLDLSFGSAAAALGVEAAHSVTDVVRAEDSEAALMQALEKPTHNLQILAAPAKTESLELDLAAFQTLLENVRRTSSYVVLDLPHAWEPWVRAALCEADEVVVVAGPDLASLRNADNLLKLMRSERDQASAPTVVLSMTGLPKRPEIPLKDFAQALKAHPVMTFAFEPELFAAAEADKQTIYEVMPDSKAALQFDTLATMLTGHEPRAFPAPRNASEQPALELVTAAPPQPAPRRKQRPKRTGFIALQEPAEKPKRRSTGLVRMVAAMAALTALGVWCVENQRAIDNAPQHDTTAFSA